MAADDESAPAPQPPISTPYLVTQPDGATQTYLWHTNRTPTIDELAGYAHSQGQQFAGVPETPAAPAAAPAPAPAVAAPAAPGRNILTHAPSIAGAIQGATYGASIGALAPPPFDVVTIPLAGIAGAALGGGGLEAAQYGAEKLFGFPAAEPGTLGQRVGSAAIRSGEAEAGGQLLQIPARAVWSAVRPAATAARELEPILTGTAETAAPRTVIQGAGEPVAIGTTQAAEALTPKYLLPQWWAQNAAGKSPGEILNAWHGLTEAEQAYYAGPQLGAVQNYMTQLAKGAAPWSLGRVAETAAVSAPAWLVSGHPNVAMSSVAPAAANLAREGFSKGMSYMLTSPGGSAWLASLPRTAEVVGPMYNFSSRVAAQPLVAEQWPAAEDLLR
jgi:hypothetical protein